MDCCCAHAPGNISSVLVISKEVSQLSSALALPVLDGNVLLVHWIVISGGQVIAGG